VYVQGMRDAADRIDPTKTDGAPGPQPPVNDPDLRDRIAAAIWERQNPGRRYADCDYRWRADAEADADAVLSALPAPDQRAAEELAKRVARAIWALKSPPPPGSEHYRSGWDDGLEAAIDAARDVVLRRLAGEARQGRCAECDHPKAAHQDGDDPVTPGTCSLCPDDDAHHDYEARQDPAPGGDRCPHCPDGHTPPDRGSQPWSAWVAPIRDADGQPMQITVARSAGAHVAESDAQWVRERLNAPTVYAGNLPLDHPLRRECRCNEAGVCRRCEEIAASRTAPPTVARPGQPETDSDDNPPVKCWHTEPNTPCDWDVCRQPERLAAGDRGTDPANE
jgi:hypothetical protein